MNIQKKTAPSEFYKELDKIIEHTKKSREAWDKALKIVRDAGFSDYEISEFLRDYLRSKIPKTSLVRYLSELKPFPEKIIDKSSIQSDPLVQIQYKNEPEQYTEPTKTIEKVKEVYDISHDAFVDEPEETKDKRLAKAAEVIKDKDAIIDQKDRTISQLQDAVKKSTFTTATDEMNIKTWDKIASPMLRTEIQKLQSQGWHFIKARLEFVS